MRSRFCVPVLALILAPAAPSASWSDDTLPSLTVPAFTAYSEPDAEALNIGQAGLTEWTDKREKLVWYGNFVKPGKLTLRVLAGLSKKGLTKYQLTVGKQTRAGQAIGAADHAPVAVDFGTVEITEPGYRRIALQALTRPARNFGEVHGLVLGGPAAEGAHFNTVAVQRGAPSVHLSYPLPKEAQVTWFYNEVTAKTDPIWSYYMACGWHRGYFGMQVNSPTERRVIFSVWDSGKEAVDRSKVGNDDKVKLLAKGDGVLADSFGNEGTGGHSHLIYSWKTGRTYRFLVAAQLDGTGTVYSGYFYFPKKHAWGLIARFRAPKDGVYPHGLYSFDEDFNSANGQRKRLAEFGRQWVKTTDGKWTELTHAVFTHTGKESRTDYDAGAVGNRFYLTGGGYADGTVKYRDTVQRLSSGKPPTDIVLPLP